MRRLWISGVAFLLDQVTKWLVTSRLELWESVPVMGDFFRLTHIHNAGAVFGLKFGGPYLHFVFSVVAMAVVCRMLYKLPRDDRASAIGLALVIGGALGNVVDRLRLGVVVDFLDFGIGSYRWYVFNVADACVTVGAGFLILLYGFGPKRDASEAPGRVTGE